MKGLRSLPLIGAMLAALVVAGCMTYRPAPLGSEPAMPSALLLSADASAIRRPFLRPTRIDLARPLDLNAVATIAVLANPDLQALRARAGIGEAQVFAAGLLPDPTFSLGIEPLIFGADPVANIAAGLGFSLNGLRTRSVARHQLRAQARQVRLDLAWSEWQTAGQARIQAVRVIQLGQYAVLAGQSSVTASAMLARVLRAIGRGDLPPGEAQAARTAAFDAAVRLRLAERDLAAADLELRRLMGLAPGQPLKLAPLAPPAESPETGRLVAIALAERADLAALREAYDAQEAGVRRAVLEQFPTLDLSVAGTRDTARNVTLGPTIAFTLPLWNRNRGATGGGERIAVTRGLRAGELVVTQGGTAVEDGMKVRTR